MTRVVNLCGFESRRPRKSFERIHALVSELVDEAASKAEAERRAGSSPAVGTNHRCAGAAGGQQAAPSERSAAW